MKYDDFWRGFADIIHELGPKNRALLEKRKTIQQQVDDWHKARAGKPHDAAAYRAFLEEIGYLVPEGPDFNIETTNVDPEIAEIPGPQLVVPIMNARFALNAANARWGSLYDALYGSDALGASPKPGGYDPEHGARVIAWGRDFLDQAVPLASGSWAEIDDVSVKGGVLAPVLNNPAQFAGHAEGRIYLKNNGLMIDLRLDDTTPVGQQDRAGISDIRLESAMSAIMDCEDSVAAVDAEDKVLAYSNWLGLMDRTLTEEVAKGGKTITRKLADDIHYSAPDGTPVTHKGRVLMLVRNVGHLMTNPAILDRDGQEVPEGIMDAVITTLCSMHDLMRDDGNSVKGSIYVVKPKMHGPDEVAFADEIFTRVEEMLGLPQYTVKLGIMDEERRTSANLKECIRAAKHRVAFINTGFLDRTGDEIHTSMEAGPMVRKGDMKDAAWISAYEDRNVDIGLACGLRGKAQIGKGMWAMPDRMADMLEQKIGHPKAGANSNVSRLTAERGGMDLMPEQGTRPVNKYLPPRPKDQMDQADQIDVLARQDEIAAVGPRGTLADLLTIPVAQGVNWSDAEIRDEIENNAQGILGYVVRWVDAGVGCSKVPDIHDVGLMEDRATCRISSQALANWLHHGVVSEDEVMDAMRSMAVKVDGQNAGDPTYEPMAPDFDGEAFKAACDLVFKGRAQPSGYTEPMLHAHRLAKKAQMAG